MSDACWVNLIDNELTLEFLYLLFYFDIDKINIFYRTRKPQSIMLVVPLISKLPKAVKGRVLKVAGELNFSLKN